MDNEKITQAAAEALTDTAAEAAETVTEAAETVAAEAAETVTEAAEAVTEAPAETAEAVADAAEVEAESIPVPAVEDIPEAKAEDIAMPQMPVVNEFPEQTGTPEYTSYVPSGTQQPEQAAEVYAAPTAAQQPQTAAPTAYPTPAYGVQPNGTQYGAQAQAQPQPQANQTYPVYYMQAPSSGDDGKGLGTASVVLGILSIIGAACCCGGLPFGITGLILGCVSSGKGNRSGSATAGIVTSAIGIVLGVICSLLVFFLSENGMF